jgi:putative oxygen-independent coproporphyrinogen III oxidase
VAASSALGIYVHVPFCARRCGYCAFVTFAPGPATAEAAHRRWTDAAVAEVAVADRELGPDRPPLTSVFLGGGTPTAVAPALLEEVLDEVRRRFEVAGDLEVSVEANPDGLADGQLDELAALGVTRVSFGMQSAIPRVLELLDRTHNPESVPRAVEAARAAGIASVSLDLIHGTPGETAADWDRTIDAALSLDPDHLSAYALGVEPGTKLAARVRSGELPEPSPDEAAERYEALAARADAAGLRWYEVSNWARTPGDRCRHNLLYWRDDDWWGIGPGAHSHVGDRRWWNLAGLEEWAETALAGRVPVAGSEVLTSEQRALERVMLGVRLAEGLPLDVVPEPGALPRLVDDGLVVVVERDGHGPARLVLTDRGRLLADTVVRALTIG